MHLILYAVLSCKNVSCFVKGWLQHNILISIFYINTTSPILVQMKCWEVFLYNVTKNKGENEKTFLQLNFFTTSIPTCYEDKDI